MTDQEFDNIKVGDILILGNDINNSIHAAEYSASLLINGIFINNRDTKTLSVFIVRNGILKFLCDHKLYRKNEGHLFKINFESI